MGWLWELAFLEIQSFGQEEPYEFKKLDYVLLV